LVEHAIENRSVGGSIPPLGTIKFKHLDERGNLLDTWCRMLAMSVPVLKFESRIELIEFQLSVFVREFGNCGIMRLLAKDGCPLSAKERTSD
jgi:hypothetical protein